MRATEGVYHALEKQLRALLHPPESGKYDPFISVISRHLLTVCLLAVFGAGCEMRSKEQLQEINAIKRIAIEAPASINTVRPEGRLTLLHRAVLDGYPDLVEWLLDRNADVDGVNKSGETPLHAAMLDDDPSGNSIARVLLKRGADPNARTPHGETPLHRAVAFGKSAKARLLLKHGADVNARAKRGETPLHVGCRQGSEQVQTTVAQGDLEESLRVLLQHDADIDSKDFIGATPLHVAVLVGNNETVRFLIAEGADVNAANNSGDTPLHYAAVFGRSREAERLLAHGASALAANYDGMTPRQKALSRPAMAYSSDGAQPVNTSEVVKVLQRHEARVDESRSDQL